MLMQNLQIHGIKPNKNGDIVSNDDDDDVNDDDNDIDDDDDDDKKLKIICFLKCY